MVRWVVSSCYIDTTERHDNLSCLTRITENISCCTVDVLKANVHQHLPLNRICMYPLSFAGNTKEYNNGSFWILHLFCVNKWDNKWNIHHIRLLPEGLFLEIIISHQTKCKFYKYYNLTQLSIDFTDNLI